MNSPAARMSDFPSTIMSMIDDHSEESPHERRTSMERLISAYRGPMVSYLRRKMGTSHEQAEDHVQQFLLQRLIEPAPQKNLLAKYAESSKHGDSRFRDYLRTALKNFFLDELRRGKPREQGWSIDPESDGLAGSGPASDPEFSLDLAQSVLNETIRTVRDECRNSEQWPVWQVFRHRFLVPVLTGSPVPDYETLCRNGLFRSPRQARNLLQTAVRKFEVTLRKIVAATLPESPGRISERVEEEIRDLLMVLKSPGAVCLSESLIVDSEAAGSEADLLVSLFLLPETQWSTWTPGDYPGLWTQVLTVAPDQLFGDDRSCYPNDTESTVGGLFQSGQPSAEALLYVKNHAKKGMVAVVAGAENSHPALPDCFFRVLYTLAVAVAQLRLQMIITRSSSAELLRLGEECRMAEWLDPGSRKILDEWVELLSVHA